MDDATTLDLIKASIDDSLVQLTRSSGTPPEARARMVEIIAHPLAFIIEEAIAESREPLESRLEAQP